MEEMLAVKGEPYQYTKTFDQAKKDTVLIIHTSGSTGIPKPVRINNAFLSRTDYDAITPIPEGSTAASSMLAKEKSLNYFGAPLFHVSGIYILCVALFRGSTIVLGPSNQSPSGDMAVQILKSLKLDVFWAAPFVTDVVFGPHGDELKERLLKLDNVCSFGGTLSVCL